MSFPTVTPTASEALVPWWFYIVVIIGFVYIIKALIEILSGALK